MTVRIDNQEKTALPDATEKWMVKLDPLKTGEPRILVVKGKNTLTIQDVPALRADLLRGIRWFVTTRYHAGATPYGNWWDWQIGVPLALNSCLACLYDELPAATLRDGTDAIEAFTPVISATGAH